MKKFLLLLILNLIAFLAVPTVAGQIFAAGSINFDKNAVTVKVGDKFDIQVMVDAGSDQISSIDAYVIYDPGLLEAQVISPGTFFPTVVNNITSGRLYVAGLVDDATQSKTGTGDVAIITFKALTQGTGTLTYDCQPGVYNSSKVIKNDIDATNIIDCAANGESTITIGAAGSVTGTGTGGNYNYTSTASGLPRAGSTNNTPNIVIPGMILLLLGGMLRLVL